MAAYEWTVLAYFSMLIVGAWLAPVPMIRRVQATTVAAGVLLVLAAGQVASPAVRAWLPHGYLVAGYWTPAVLVPAAPSRWFEEWLVRRDRWWRRSLPPVPAWLTPLVELAYLLCYPLVPMAFAIVWTNDRGGDVERFWLAVLISGYACYATLPWLVSRPPRLVETGRTDGRGALVAMNTRVLARVSHQFNTFPSGHVAVAAAAAAAVATVSLPAGVSLGVLVAAIGVGAAAGGYHYVEDILWGLAVAGAAHLAAAAM
jgi:hypothetical protein